MQCSSWNQSGVIIGLLLNKKRKGSVTNTIYLVYNVCLWAFGIFQTKKLSMLIAAWKDIGLVGLLYSL